jgi:hypothetical protein
VLISSLWYPRSLPTIFLIHFVLDGVGKNWIYECLFILYCFFSHSYLMNLSGLKLTLISVLILLYSLMLMVVFLNDIEGVRIPCLCILYSNTIKIKIYAWTLGSFLISFKAPSSSYHHIFLCPIGSLGLLIACLLHSLKLPSLCHLFTIFDPQYGFTSSKYC